ncbi:hypothetical protein ACLBYD_26625 [Rhodococcus sp. C26F]
MACLSASLAAGCSAHPVTEQDLEAVVRALSGYAPSAGDFEAVQHLLGPSRSRSRIDQPR